MSTSTNKGRKKRSDLFAEVAEEMVALAIVSRIAEELVDGIDCISDGDLELWLVGAGSTSGVKPDNAEVLAIANNNQLGMEPSKDRLSSKLPLKKVVTNVSRLKAGGINRCKGGSSGCQSSHRSPQGSLGVGKKQKTPSGSTQSRKMRHASKSKRVP